MNPTPSSTSADPLPRDLSDVLHYFLPDAEESAEADRVGIPGRSEERTQAMRNEFAAGRLNEPEARARRLARNKPALSLLPLIAVPIETGDLVAASFTWNLAVEVARLGGRAIVLTASDRNASALWPKPGVGPLGAELEEILAPDLASLDREARNLAARRTRDAADGGLVFVQIPPAWIHESRPGSALLRWTLLFTACERKALSRAFTLSKRILKANPLGQIGIGLYSSVDEKQAEESFARISRACQQKLGRKLLSYGQLREDLHVYRSIVSRQPIGLAHPQAPVARALRQVAQRLLEDARSRKP